MDGYPHQHWFPAVKEGYSGVALFSKEEPIKVDVIILLAFNNLGVLESVRFSVAS